MLCTAFEILETIPSPLPQVHLPEHFPVEHPRAGVGPGTGTGPGMGTGEGIGAGADEAPPGGVQFGPSHVLQTPLTHTVFEDDE